MRIERLKKIQSTNEYVKKFIKKVEGNIISKNGKGVQLKLVNEVEEGLITVKTYKAIT